MHLASEAVALECAALGFAAAASGVGYSVWQLGSSKRDVSEPAAHLAWKAASLGALVFAAQMLNIPVLSSFSVHFVGGVLLAELLGPALGVLTMSTVLLLQAVLLGDGGIAALGVNITNMALVPAGSLIVTRKVIARPSLAVLAASVVSILLAVILIGGEVAIGRSSAEIANWTFFVGAMLTNHLPLLPLEAVLTLVLVALAATEKVGQRSTWRVPAMAATAAVSIALIATAASSSLPDGYEWAATVARMDWLLGGQ
jgi:cobalt/nickel transport system permease protein